MAFFQITGDSNLKIGSNTHVHITFGGCPSYKGIVTLTEEVKSVTVAWNDAQSIAAVLKMLNHLPKTVTMIYVPNDEHLKKIPKNLKHKVFIQQ